MALRSSSCLLGSTNFAFLRVRFSRSFPILSAEANSSRRIHWRMRVRARDVFTNPSQSRFGRCFLSVMTSTVSPFLSSRERGAICPLILAPEHWCPTSVWTVYAKSIGVASFGRALTSPSGVNTKISPRKRSMRRNSMNSSGSAVSCCHSRTCRNQISASSTSFAPFLSTSSSLYLQCAAIPYSAVLCISSVRICISYLRPSGPNTVV